MGAIVSGVALTPLEAFGQGGFLHGAASHHTHTLRDAAAIGQVLIADGLLPVDPGMLRAGLGVGYEDVTRLLKRPWGRQIREDFAVARTVHAQGWLLSRTEASLCLLAALAYGPQNV